MQNTAIYYTASQLAGLDKIPGELTVRNHLVYSSPATLAFNSPGAESYGVKRAGLAVPGSVMLIVSPGCCGRNTSSISSMPAYEGRFFYLTINETDLITGRHLKKIPDAVKALCESLPEEPSVVMICITCVDALLGTDMERVCRSAEEAAGVRVRPCYMYALTRDGNHPPMADVRRTIYGLLEKKQRRSRDINIIGYFAPLAKDCELYGLLQKGGVKKIRQTGTCGTYEEFLDMAGANVNLVLNEEARPAAADMEKKLGIPSIELKRLYRTQQIHRQYMALGQVLEISFDDEAFLREAEEAKAAAFRHHPDAVFAVGECCNADPFELALALAEQGFAVAEIFGVLNAQRMRYAAKLAEISPDTRIYMNQSPFMTGYSSEGSPVTVTIGSDAAYYHNDCPNIPWDSEEQPFGYQGVRDLFTDIDRVLSGQRPAGSKSIHLADDINKASAKACPQHTSEKTTKNPDGENLCPKSLRLHLTPFAPDQSGAEEVFFEMGGVSVVMDAGGCTGNICGFDEPRWFSGIDDSFGQGDRKPSPVMSAGMRDIDAVLGRDERLLKPLSEVSRLQTGPEFTALIGTPVPSVTAMDYSAVAHMVKNDSGAEIIFADTNGMQYYDAGASKAYLALLERFAGGSDPTDKANAFLAEDKKTDEKFTGVFGATPLDIGDSAQAKLLQQTLEKETGGPVYIYGCGAGLPSLKKAGNAAKNIVVSVSGLKAARWLKEKSGTHYEINDPLAENIAGQIDPADVQGRRILVVHQQVRTAALAKLLKEAGAAEVVQATWFMTDPEISECRKLKEETDLTDLLSEESFDTVITDPVCRALIPAGWHGTFVPAVHFAVSGRLK